MPGDLPKRLKQDAIVEANFEVRFNADATSVPEILFGRLADNPDWRGFNQRRLPTADIPAVMRRADPNLRYQPAIDLVHPDGSIVVRMGPQSLAYSRLAPYPGWDKFGSEISRVIERLFSCVPKVAVTRLGLRYINALRSDVHGISDVNQLTLEIRVNNEVLRENLSLAYRFTVSTDSSCIARIASPDFAQGSIPENTTIIVDLDVFTNEPYVNREKGAVLEWKEIAHGAAKQSFFDLLKADTIAALREDQ